MSVPNSIPDALTSQIERLRADFEREWSDGRSPNLEVWLDQVPPAQRQQTLLALLPVEMQWRYRRSRPVSGPELMQRFVDEEATVINFAEAATTGMTQEDSDVAVSTGQNAVSNVGSERLSIASLPTEVIVEKLRRCRTFSGLPYDSLVAISACLEDRHYRPGEVLLHQGTFATELLILQQGQVEVVLTDERGRNYEINSLGPHQVLGEMSLLTQEPATASVIALRPTHVLALPARAFHDLAMREPWLSMVLTNVVASRLGKAQRDVLSGKEFAGFRIVRRLGVGGMSVVYEATRLADDARVALKMMSHRLVYDERALEQFQHEADLIEKFDHPHIVRMYRRFQAFHTYFIAMQFCDGQDLRTRLKSEPALDPGTSARILAQIAQAVAYSHRSGVVHRDIKPSNILVTPENQAILVDFGLAKPSIDAQNYRCAGTPRYMAPEQLAGQPVTEHADLFSFGCVAYEVFSGKPLIAESAFDQILLRHRNWSIPRLSDECPSMHPDLAMLIERCLSPNPVDRGIDLDHLATVVDNHYPAAVS